MEAAHVYPKGCAFSSLDEIAGKRVTVMGLGLNGGGEACVRFFLRHGAYVTVTDMKNAEQLMPTITALKADSSLDHSRLRYVLGEHRLEDFSGANCVIKNPGVKFEGNRFLAAAHAIETDISTFLSFTKAPIIAVTGSKGKSTTVSAIHYGLCKAGFTAFLGGNITVSPLTFLEQTNETTPVVLELSSWQLADLRGRGVLKPAISLITKIVKDHQNWYGGMAPYIADKKLIYADQTSDCITILDADPDDYLVDCPSPRPGCSCWGDEFASETKATVFRYSAGELASGQCGAFQVLVDNEIQGRARLPLFPQKTERIMGALKVPGAHNRINVLNAALVLCIMRVEPKHCEQIMGTWQGIPHRLEHFYDWKNPATGKTVAFFNDSCATVPEAAAAAVQAFEKPVVLVCGGTDKQLDFLPLVHVLDDKDSNSVPETCTMRHPLATYLLAGSGTDKLLALLAERRTLCHGPFDSLFSLLQELWHDLISLPHLQKTEVVVLSPGATSFGMFTNEFDRGTQFKQIVQNLFSKEAGPHA